MIKHVIIAARNSKLFWKRGQRTDRVCCEGISRNGSMNIQVAVLCDAATDDNGKLNLLGAFDTIYTQQLPAIHPQCSIALRVTFSSGDEGKHSLALNFVDADGHSIAKFPPIPVEVALPDDMHFGT